MGVVTVSSTASRTPLGLSTKFSNHRSILKKPLIVAFKGDNLKKTTLVTPHEPSILPIETCKEIKNRVRKAKKPPSRVKTAVTDEASTSTMEVDYNEAAGKFESIFKLSPTTSLPDIDEADGLVRRGRRGRKIGDGDKRTGKKGGDIVIKRQTKKAKRMSLDKRIELKRNKEEEKEVLVLPRKRKGGENEDDKIDKLLKEYSGPTDLVSFDWKKMKIPPVLPSSEHTWLFNLMQPLKELLKVRESLQNAMGGEPTETELSEATNMSVVDVKRHLAVGRAARNKLISHNLRFVLFVMKIYFRNFSNGPNFQDLCQAGANGLITAIDRFEPKRKFRFYTYGFFYIRHAIVRSMIVSSFTRVSFGLETVRVEIQKAKLELMFELKRLPTVEEIIEKIGISPKRYHDVMRASKPVESLHSKNLINAISDVDGVGGNDRRRPALLRFALDDVLDSLKPKESLVIRQRYGLDGKGDRTLGEIAGNLNISREMVRKHEVKALMKLKHPARMDYLRRYMV